MNVRLIKTEIDYENALKRLEIIFDVEIGTEALTAGKIRFFVWYVVSE